MFETIGLFLTAMKRLLIILNFLVGVEGAEFELLERGTLVCVELKLALLVGGQLRGR